MTLGEDGYNRHTQNILETTQAIAKGVESIKGIRLLGGTPEAMIVCFGGTFLYVCYRIFVLLLVQASLPR